MAKVKLPSWIKESRGRMGDVIFGTSPKSSGLGRCGRGSIPQEKEMLEREIAATDRQIEALVNELSPSGMISPKGMVYGLTEEEIKIVEGDG